MTHVSIGYLNLNNEPVLLATLALDLVEFHRVLERLLMELGRYYHDLKVWRIQAVESGGYNSFEEEFVEYVWPPNYPTSQVNQRRQTRNTLSIDWDSLDPKWKYATQDCDGDIKIHELKPSFNSILGWWFSQGESELLQAKTFISSAKDSLTVRPE
jgi:hypothetical protein